MPTESARISSLHPKSVKSCINEMPNVCEESGIICSAQNVGILAMEIYFPYFYVDQNDLEEFDQISKGKYTTGLGQQQMGFCSDNEDINSLCLTVVSSLMEKHHIDYSQIGRLEVGTETIIDKSKSVKSVLMTLFEDSGNFDVEGVDTTNACYGGTSALFNAVSWVESSAWDGRYALVVCGDIAVYANGNARCTGGAGAAAMLIGPSAPLVIEPGLRGTYMRHAYDFYKPDLRSEYPVVDGELSVKSYISALDNCYQLFCHKADKLSKSAGTSCCLEDMDYVLFHSPYCKLVQKSLSRLTLIDFVGNKMKHYSEEKRRLFEELSNVKKSASELLGKRIGLFSYGSGLAASMFSIRVTESVAVEQSGKFTLAGLASGLSDIPARLECRQRMTPESFTAVLQRREQTHMLAPYEPESSAISLFPGTYYLQSVDEKFRRTYKRKPSVNMNGDSARAAEAKKTLV